MNCIATAETRPVDARNECVLDMPLGLLGFEHCKRFALQANAEDEPFLWLQALDESKIAFLVLSPFVAMANYRPEISNEDVGFLGLGDPKDTLIFNIVTVRGPQQATINLKGPIVLNRRTLRAKQVIPLNASEFSVAYPLKVQAN